MMIAIESEGLFRTFMEFSFVLFLRVCSDSQDIFMLSFFDGLLRCYRQCLGRERIVTESYLKGGEETSIVVGTSLEEGATFYCRIQRALSLFLRIFYPSCEFP